MFRGSHRVGSKASSGLGLRVLKLRVKPCSIVVHYDKDLGKGSIFTACSFLSP